MRELSMFYSHTNAIGYGRMGIKLAKAMAKAGVCVHDQTFLDGSSLPPKVNVGLWCATPGHARGWWEGQYSTILTMWEATVIPPAFRESFDAFDQIFVPSEQNLEMFSKHHPNVTKINLGVDPDDWHFTPREDPEEEFIFLVSGSGKRKGGDLALRAFLQLWGRDGSWGNGPRPRLVIKSPKGEDFDLYDRGFRRAEDYSDRVSVIRGRTTAEEERALYAKAQCFLAPSRGEGFGLQPLQAMAQGCPTILTDAHGHSEFSFLGIPIPAKLVQSDYFIFGNAGDWWEPDFDALCSAMQQVYNNREAFGGEASATYIAENFSWDRTAQRLIRALGDQLSQPYSGSGEWLEPEKKLFPIVVTRPVKIDVAGVLYRFEPGKDYYQTGAIKAMLYERGILNPSCLEGTDPGVPESQLDIASYSAAHGNCPFCNKPLNEGPTESDKLFEAMQAADPV